MVANPIPVPPRNNNPSAYYRFMAANKKQQNLGRNRSRKSIDSTPGEMINNSAPVEHENRVAPAVKKDSSYMDDLTKPLQLASKPPTGSPY